MIYIVKINDKEYEVEVERGKANILKTSTVAESSQPLQQTPVPVAESKPAVSHVTGTPIKAPMPGTIIDINVSVGNSVKKGDVLFILEAMKMENEITAPCDGIIKQIVVAKHTSVSTGDTLIVMQ